MLICPLCRQPLIRDGQSLSCPQGHRFDLARQGYVNLLPVQHKNSRAPGDNQQMVEARRRFLARGHYLPIAHHVSRLAAALQPQQWLDIGCGEGYYSNQIAQALPYSHGYALDISKQAIRRACALNAQITWLVAGMNHIPLTDASCQLIISLFSPLDWREASRLINPNGSILRIGPASEHLVELRRLLYDDVRDYRDDKHLQKLPTTLQLRATERLRFTLNLTQEQDRTDLLSMTPYGWRASAQRREAVLDKTFEVTVSVRLDHLIRNA